MSTLASRWPGARAALISAVILFNLIGALPKPDRLTWDTLHRPDAKAELAQWTRLARSLGLAVDEEGVGGWAIHTSGAWLDLRRWLLAPWQPVIDFTQTQQGWGLFAWPDRAASRLEIAWRAEGGAWVVLYRTADAEHDWGSGVFRYRRVRALYNPGVKPPGTIVGFSRSLAEGLFEAEPSAAEVRFRLLQRHVDLPGEAPKRIPEERWRKVIQREEGE